MSWRVVKCLTTLRDQIDAACPGRAKGADGTIGDLAHQLESTSDHDPHLYTVLGAVPVVCALDVTHDPGRGCDTYAMAEIMRQARDPRVGYIISNRRITGPNHSWQWDDYHGSRDPHTGHMHVSSVHTAIADNTDLWRFTAAGPAPAPTFGGFMAGLSDLEQRQLFERVEALIYGRDAATDNGSGGKVTEPNGSVTLLKQLLARPAGGITDVQVQALGQQVAAAVAAHPATSLSTADMPIIEAAVADVFATAFPAG